MSEARRRVVVTGVGAVTAFGVGAEALSSGMRDGRSAVTALKFPEYELPCLAAGRVPGFDPSRHLSPVESRRLMLFSQYALVASREAWGSAGLPTGRVDRTRVATVLGNGGGAFSAGPALVDPWRSGGWTAMDPLTLVKALPDVPTQRVSLALDLSGPILTCTASCASGT